MLFVRLSRETQEMVFDAHDGIALFKGACQRGILRQHEDAVETILVGKERVYNRVSCRCAAITGDPVACTPASAGEGQVENQVGSCASVLHAAAAVKNLDELNAWLLDKCIAYAKAHRHPELTDQTIWECSKRTAEARSLCGRFDGFHSVPASVSKTCLVRSTTTSTRWQPTQSGVRSSSCLCRPIVIRQDGGSSPNIPVRSAVGLRSTTLGLRPGARPQARLPARSRCRQDGGHVAEWSCGRRRKRSDCRHARR